MANRDIIEIHYRNKVFQVRRNQISALPFPLWNSSEIQQAIKSGNIKDINKINIEEKPDDDYTQYQMNFRNSKNLEKIY